MQLPPGTTEAALLEAIEKVVPKIVARFMKRLAGVLSQEDLGQQVRLWALEGVATGRFDATRGRLDAFLWTHCRNRASNMCRDRVSRMDAPCERCSADDPCGPEGQVCELFAAWKARNTTKWAINRGISLEFADPDREANLSLADDSPSAASASELSRLIDSELPVSLRIDYLRMRDGLKVPKDRRVAVQRAVADILRRAGVDVPFPADDGWKSAWEAAQGAARQQLEASGFDKTSIETFTEKELQESANSTPAGSVAP